MVVIERSSSLSSLTSSRKEKQSKSGEKGSNELLKGILTRKTSSNSSPSTPSKKGKQSVSCLKDNVKVDHEEVERKLARKTCSTSSPSTPYSKKGKQSVSCVDKEKKDHHEEVEGKLARKTSSISSPSTPSKNGRKSVSRLKDGDHEEMLKGKLTRKTSLLSSCSSSPSSPSTRKGKQSVSCEKDGMNNEVHKEKPVRKASLLSTSSRSPTKKELRRSGSGNGDKTRKGIKSRIKELGPICKKRKEVLDSINVEEDIDVYLDEQINEQGKNHSNNNDCMWLTSGSMSPEEFGLFMSALDPGLDEWVMSFLPKSSRTPKADGSKMIAHVSETDSSGTAEEANESSLARTHSLNSSCSSVAASTNTDSSTFWNMDRTGVWVSLINLDMEDSKFISDVDSKLDELESDFPSPNFKGNWDSSSSDVGGVSSSAKSTTQESGSQSEWSSDLLSDSMDWEVDDDDPIYWPYGVDCDWDHKCMDSFSISPRKGLYKIKFKSGEDSCAIPPDSIRFRLHGRNGKKILFLSGLSASKMIEFKKGCRKNSAGASAGAGPARGKKLSKIGKRGNRYRKRVPPILENDLEGISPKDTPKESVKKGKSSSYIDLSDIVDNWGDEIAKMDSDSPLYWPTDQKSDWKNGTWDDCFNISPRRSTESKTNVSSPKSSGFSVSSSVRLKFLPKKMKLLKSGLTAVKNFRYKSVSQRTDSAVPDKRLMVVVPRKGRSVFKSSKNVSFKHGNQGKRKRDLPLKGGKSVKEFIRLVSILGVNKMFPGNEVSSEEVPIETLLGLDEFDGQEGVDMELEDADSSLMECMGD